MVKKKEEKRYKKGETSFLAFFSSFSSIILLIGVAEDRKKNHVNEFTLDEHSTFIIKISLELQQQIYSDHHYSLEHSN